MSRNWFADKLGTPQPGERVHRGDMVVQRPQQPPQHVSPDGQWVWNGASWVPNQVQEIPPPPPPMPTKTTFGRADGACPQCGDDKQYFRPATSAAMRCFKCGYTDGRDFVQTNSYDSVSSTGQPAGAPVKGQSGGGYHPDVIVGRIE